MQKFEAETLEEAYAKASEVLECSISELQCEVLQHPSKGLLGLFKKSAIIMAVHKSKRSEETVSQSLSTPVIEEEVKTFEKVNEEEIVASEIVATIKEESQKTEKEKSENKNTNLKTEAVKDTVLDSFFESGTASMPEVIADTQMIEDEALEHNPLVYDELAQMIEGQLTELLSHSCFDIDVVEVDVRDNTALIFIDGNDAALLIGKEGYRYNALSYMLFNWLHTKYDLFIKLEIAEFLTTQQKMIRKYIQPVIANVEKLGKGKTRFLDGILVQIALEQLRERFPDKYVAVKTAKEGKKFVVINEFNSKKTYV